MGSARVMRTRRRFVLAWGGVLAIAVSSAQAQVAAGADRLALAWQAPDECPSRADVRAAVASRLGEAAERAGPALRAEARVERDAAGYRLALKTEYGERRLAARSCAELAGAAALILALLIDPEADATAPPPAPAPRELWLVLRPALAVDAGILPSIALGPAFGAGVRLNRSALELSGTFLPSQDAFRSERPSAVADVSLWAAALGACQALTRPIELSPCLHVEYGRLVAAAQGLPNAAQLSAHWVAVWAGGRAAVALTRWVWASLELSVGLPVLGATFKVNAVGTAHETGDVLGRLRTGVEFRL